VLESNLAKAVEFFASNMPPEFTVAQSGSGPTGRVETTNRTATGTFQAIDIQHIEIGTCRPAVSRALPIGDSLACPPQRKE
jgi:hypothetical protein